MQTKIIMLLGIILVITGLAGTVYYYKSKYNSALVDVTVQKQKVATLTAEKKSLISQSKKTKKTVEGYVRALDKMSENNLALSSKLQAGREKLANHKLLSLRNGRHSELVLKVINRSVLRQNKHWMSLSQKDFQKQMPKEAK